jgi:hypothetical protein
MRNRPLIAVLLVLTLVAFGALIWVHHLDTVKEMEELRKQADEDGGYIDIWADELRSLEDELRSLDVNDHENVAEGLGSYLFLVTKPVFSIMTDIEPVLSEAGLTGHLCVSQSSFPDDEGNCSRWQAGILAELGWDICIEVNADTDVNELIYRLWLIDLPEPVAAYFPDSNCIKDKADALKNAGIGVVIVRGEIPSELPEGMTAVRCLGISDEDMMGKAESYASDGESFVFTIGFDLQEDLFSYDTLHQAIDTGRVISERYGAAVTGFDRMKELTDKRNALIEDVVNTKIEHRDELLKRCEELKELIASGN